jgi:hypothetical protein
MVDDIKVDIQERETPGGVAVDLKINDQVINTGNNPISSFSFWEDLEQAVQRSIFRIKTKNPKMGFDFNIHTMGMTNEEKAKRFLDFAKKKCPDVDVEKAFDLLDKEIATMQLTGPDDNHPNPYMKSPINSDLVKILFLNVLSKYNK